MALAECYLPQLGCEALYPGAGARLPHHTPPPPLQPRKDYSVPLHVDCSVEYELPDCAKPPQGVKIEPLLMIHPSHFRRLDSLRRCPFVNNLPSASGGTGYELPPPAAPAPAPPACQFPRAPVKTARAPRARQRPETDRWCPPSAVDSCCTETYDPYWIAPAPVPKEGDTLENSGFGKCPQQRYRSARHKLHPYAPDSGHGHTALAQNCDKTLEMLQGNRLISPFHAKMFSGDAVYQNYPIVMYK